MGSICMQAKPIYVRKQSVQQQTHVTTPPSQYDHKRQATTSNTSDSHPLDGCFLFQTSRMAFSSAKRCRVRPLLQNVSEWDEREEDGNIDEVDHRTEHESPMLGLSLSYAH